VKVLYTITFTQLKLEAHDLGTWENSFGGWKMKKFLILLLAAFTLFALAQTDTSGGTTDTSGTSTDTSGTATDTMASGTVVDVITSSPDHKTLLAALTAAGLSETLAGAGPYTVFAPTDAAFEAYVTSAGLASADDLLADPNLASILQGHVVPSALLSADILSQAEAAGGTLEVTALNGSPITITVADGVVTLNGTAKVTTADLAASNGVVHVIDGVLAPAAAQ
jgi:uncharacterized surface protein with fasciclin (FAS1) repeats